MNDETNQKTIREISKEGNRGDADRTIRLEDEKQVFKRRDSLQRTPPGISRSRSVSTPGTDKEITAIPKKRKVGDTSMEGEGDTTNYNRVEVFEAAVVKGCIEDISKLMKMLACNVEQNTKREIKDISAKLKRQVDMLNRKAIQDWIEKQRYAETVIKKDADTQTEKEAVEMRIQTIENKKEEVFMKHWRKLSDTDNVEELNNIINIEWPKNIYKKTHLVEESIWTAKEGDAMVIATEVNQGLDNVFMKEMAKTNTQVRSILENRMLEPGKIIGIRSDNAMINEEGTQSENRSKYICIIGLSQTEQQEEYRNLTAAVIKAKIMLQRLGITEVACATPKGAYDGPLRKAMEYSYRKDGVNVKIYNPYKVTSSDKNRAQQTTEDEKYKWQRVNKKTDKIIISRMEGNEEVSYASVLRNLQENINIEKIGVKVRNIKQTKTGKIVIRTTGKSECKDELVKEINEKMREKISAKVEETKKTIFIKDIHELKTKEEVTAALTKSIGDINSDKDELNIKMASKPNRNGVLYAIVTMEATAASVLLKKRKINIGWNECRVEELLTPKRCFKCDKYGHEASKCREEGDMKNKCYKCSEEGHRAKECKNEPLCYVCGAKGHRPDSMTCPVYRGVVKEMRGSRERTNNKEQ